MTKILFGGFVAFLAWMIWLANTGQTNLLIDLGNTIPLGDKVGHFLLMGMLAFFANMLLKHRRVQIKATSILLGSLLVGIFVFLEECSQLFIPSRTFSLLDLLSDALGIYTFGLFARRTAKDQ